MKKIERNPPRSSDTLRESYDRLWELYNAMYELYLNVFVEHRKQERKQRSVYIVRKSNAIYGIYSSMCVARKALAKSKEFVAEDSHIEKWIVQTTTEGVPNG